MTYISEKKQCILEGELRAQSLSEHLKQFDAPNEVWISEDGTSIVAKAEYDARTNQIIGLVLPLDSNGMPITFTFMARSADEIETNMENQLSSLVYIVMAHSLKENVPPFLLQIYGTNNRFTTLNVLDRWKHTKIELAK